MEEELSLDNILDKSDIDNLFTPDTDDTPTSENKEEDNQEDNNTVDVSSDDLFEETQESVGSEDENIEDKEDTDSDKASTSPTYIYSSIAKALKEEGIFPDLDDESADNIKAPEDFRALIDRQIQAGLDERQKRIDDALNAGVEPSEIKKYENTINYLGNISDELLSEEGDNGEDIRKRLIYQDFINRGYSQERANREVQKSLNGGTDIEDAKEALKSNIEFFQGQYNNMIKEAKIEEEKALQNRKAQAESLKKSILEDSKMFGDLQVDKSTRQRIYDNISKPIYKDPDTGEYFTSIQKYEMENRVDFLKNVGLLYTLTDGFKNIGKLINGKVNKEVKKGLRELESKLNNTARTSDGNLKFMSGSYDDPESYIGKGWDLDL